MTKELNNSITGLVEEYSSKFNYELNDTAIILAAGHGKRIKSQTSKMLHRIWGVPTVLRVFEACKKGMENLNSIVVVGIKAEDVTCVVGKNENTLFAYQAEQNGTGHAVQVALERLDVKKYEGNIFVLPGDMGLIDSDTIRLFRDNFIQSGADMMVLTGLYEGNYLDNYYGRIIRVKEKDINGVPSLNDFRKVIEIMEYKDILNLSEDKLYTAVYNGKKYSYTRDELLRNNEFNSGVYVFKSKHLAELISKIESNNVQKEIYITDLISIFNNNGLTVAAVSPNEQYVLMGFNNKSVLKEMDAIARHNAYEKLKDIVEIDDPDDFFIDDSVIESIINKDKEGKPLDIRIGKGVYIGHGARLNYNLSLEKNVFIDAAICFGENVTVKENTHFSAFAGQQVKIGNNVSIYMGDLLKGSITIGNDCNIESGVNITGSDEFPVTIGDNVTIKGNSYIFGSQIDKDFLIERCVLINKKIEKPAQFNGNIFHLKNYMPYPEGVEAVKEVK
jgi:bifunctional UDP-N-acetylglucosamine pyrophosphorylase/glucosamine-1-phosphate N-acetyltransferase